MKVYTNKEFTGHYPVGSAAVIVANDTYVATEELYIVLTEHGLLASNAEKSDFDKIRAGMVEVDISFPHAIMLVDGNY